MRTRAATLPQHISATDQILSAALRLLRAELPIEIRLMGLRMSNFAEVHLEPGQRSIAAFVQGPPRPDSAGAATKPACSSVADEGECCAEMAAGRLQL